MKKPLFINLSGPSGIGKTTTIKTLVEQAPQLGLQLRLPIKLTTRGQKPSDNTAEMTFVSLPDFAALNEAGKLQIAYEDHGNHYGLTHASLLVEPGTILIQAIPLRISRILQADQDIPVRVVTVCLTADPDVVRHRLIGRQDPISDAERTSRIKSASKPPHIGADHYFDMDRPLQTVVSDLATLIKSMQDN